MTRVLGGVLIFCLAAAVSAAPRQTTAARARITGIHHVAFRVSSLDASGRFYGDLLGLSGRPISGTGARAYAVGGHQAIVLEPGLAAHEEERLSHVAFATPDLAETGRYLAARGLEVGEPVQSCGEVAIRVKDPNGHSIEFVQSDWPPPSSGGAGGGALSTRLLHAGLIVADESRAHTFYRDALGFVEIWRGGRADGVIRWINMRVADGTDYVEYMLGSAAPERRERGVLHHVCLRVADIQTAWEEVGRRSAGLKIAHPSPPQIGTNGRYQLNLYDPDGTRIELMEPFTVR